MHTKIENFLTTHYGDVGKKIHTGRSRNDQVATTVRLCAKSQLLCICHEILNLGSAFLNFAQKHEMIPMPGYTHMQKAMPSTVGMWAGSFVESLLDDVLILEAAYAVTDQSPLGSAAGYGVPLSLDRELTAKLLGFSKVQKNALYCQNSRGKFEAAILGSLTQILLTINKFASDVLLFTTNEFGFFTVVDELVTGSSIMPQKKNIDVAELLRSKVHGILGNYTKIASLSSNLPSGYNRDFQDLKKPLIESLEITVVTVSVAKILLEHITPNQAKLASTMTPELFATHHALALVSQGMPFRQAYQQVAKELLKTPKMTNIEFEHMLKMSNHIGGTGNLGIGKLKKQLTIAIGAWKKEETEFKKTIESLVKGGEYI